CAGWDDSLSGYIF
nr:immunoglobulin light chain junction region [Macaca mulatta]MPO08963.1 immunoglobulin light chain junction region [Macaca mulatta]MPO09897.1 immunoglobulin light chain junction region [Macaca mulatta]MPO10263.1 immunoglobulin light chain junction region [Macaca mulatta]MPO11060.1 immunoglobulin light chain junction region [Macaca mulatta]